MKPASSENRPEKLTTADLDDLGVAAYFASVERLERELTARWEKLQGDTYWTIDSAPVTEKYKPLQKFFNDAEVLVAETIHEYFQPLLKVAITHRQHLGNKSPLATLAEWIDWTESQVLRVVCNFLATDERLVKWAGSQNPQLGMSLLSDSEFDPTSESKEDSRVLRSAERLTGEWQEDGDFREFLLPRWTQVHHPALALRHSEESAEERSAWDAKFNAERMSRAETMQWVKQLEISFSMKIAIQIHKDARDGVLEAGQMHALVTENRRGNGVKCKTGVHAGNDWDNRILSFKFLAIEQHLKGSEYCAFLDRYNIRTSLDWQKQGCPKLFSTAYKEGRWRGLIHKEKTRVKTRMRPLPRTELDRILTIARSAVSARD